MGLKGDKGDAGIMGLRGVPGVNIKGDTGDQGAQGIPGTSGSNGNHTTVTDQGGGNYLIEAGDGTSVILTNGSVPVVTDNGNGTFTITSGGQSVIVNDGYTPSLGVDYYNGNNGDYHSFVYKSVTKGSAVPDAPTGGTYNGTLETIPTGWLDDNNHSNGNTTYISTNTYVHTATTDSWALKGAWSTPKVFIETPDADPQSKVTGFAFVRASTQPAAPTGGSFASPTPTIGGWTDGIPSGVLPLWMTSALFTSDGELPQNQTSPVPWGTPELVGQSAEGTRHKFSVSNSGPWSLTPSSTDEWMIVSTYDPTTDIWTDDILNPVRIKGETGAAAQQIFRSVAFKRSTDPVFSETPTGGNYSSPYPVDGIVTGWLDAVPGGDGAVYASYRTFTSDAASPQEADWSASTLYAVNGQSSDVVWVYYEGDPGIPTDSAGVPTAPITWYGSVADAVTNIPGGSPTLWSSTGIRPGNFTLFTWNQPIQVEGQSVAEVTAFYRGSSPPHLTVPPLVPPNAGQYDFGTHTLTPPTGYTTTPAPSNGVDSLYSITAIAAGSDVVALPDSVWVGPVEVTQEAAAQYIHIAYSAYATGSPSYSTTDGTNRPYIGVYYGLESDEGNLTNTSYTWSKNGADMFHIAYADSSDGLTNFSYTVATGREYVGTYVGVEEVETNLSAGDYSWQKVKGEVGDGGITPHISRAADLLDSANDGTGYSFSNTGGTFSLYQDGSAIDPTTITFSVVGSPSNGLTCAIVQTTGAYSLSGSSPTWTGDRAAFTLRAVYGGITYEEVYSVAKVKVGPDGAQGIEGPAGNDALTVEFPKTSVVLAADSAGVVTDFTDTDTSLRLKAGDTYLTWDTTPDGSGDGDWEITSITNVNCTGPTSVTHSGTGAATIGDITAISADIAERRVNVSYRLPGETLKSFTLYQYFAKAKAGAEGGTGSTGPTGTRTAHGLVYKTEPSASASTPSATSYNFSTGNFSGLTAEWDEIPPTSDASETNDYWASRFVVTEATFGGSQTIYFATPVETFNFTSMVTFTDLSTDSSTVIHGANISTGAIQSSNTNPIPEADSAPVSLENGAYIDIANGKFVFGNASEYIWWNGTSLSISGVSIDGSTITGGSYDGNAKVAVENSGTSVVSDATTLDFVTGLTASNVGGEASISINEGAINHNNLLNGGGNQHIDWTGASAGTIDPTNYTNTTYSAATATVAGLIELEDNTVQSVAANAVTTTASRTYGLQVNSSGQGVINVPWTDTTYSAATTTVAGLIELEDGTVQSTAANTATATAARTYGLQVNAAGQGVINVPWTDTTYTGGTHLSLAGTTFNHDDVSIGLPSPIGDLDPFAVTDKVTFLSQVSHNDGHLTGAVEKVLDFTTGIIEVSDTGVLDITANSIDAAYISGANASFDTLVADVASFTTLDTDVLNADVAIVGRTLTVGNLTVNASAIPTLGEGAVLDKDGNLTVGNATSYIAWDGSTFTILGKIIADDNITGVQQIVGDNVFFGTNAGDSAGVGAINNIGIGKDALTTLTTGDENIALGTDALKLTNGSQNIAVGYKAGDSISSGSYNIALGTSALHQVTTGLGNVGIGLSAGARLATTASANIAIGFAALGNSTGTSSASNNIGIGNSALNKVTSGTANVGIGINALKEITTGQDNVALGTNAGSNVSTATSSVLIGYQAGDAITTVNGFGNLQAFVGTNAGGATTSGVACTFIGANAGLDNTTGTGNIAVGANSDVSATVDNQTVIGRDATTTGVNATAIGYNTTAAANKMRLGDDNITHIEGFVDFTVASDARDKINVADLALGLDFVTRLRPVTYDMNPRSRYYEEVNDAYEEFIDEKNKSAMRRVPINKRSFDFDETQYLAGAKVDPEQAGIGLIAQEVEAALPEGQMFPGVYETQTAHGDTQKRMSYTKLVPVLINAINEQQQQIEELQKTIIQLQKAIQPT